MADDQKDRYIQYLAEQNQDLRLTNDAMKLVLEDFMVQMKELKDQVSSMQSKQSDLENRLSEERKLRQSAERKAKSLQEKLDFANQERFGDRRQRIHSKAEKSASDRQKEKDDYDGTDDTLRTDSVTENKPQEIKGASGKGRDLSNRPEGYKTMGVTGEAIEHPSDLTKVFERIIERRILFAYLDDGELPIGNNLAERTIRKLTTQRNNTLHYDSDAGAEMAVTYHSVIGTVKLHGSSVWNFIGTFFKNIFNGCRDYVNMVPDKITLVTCQC